MAAQSLTHSGGPLGAYYRRMRARIGPAEAITAAAHKLARIFYQLWTEPELYDPTLLERHEQQHTQRMINSLRKRARSFGLELVPQTLVTQ